jgi:glycosyltransferase involved in cell wall biosynthesis
VSDGGSSDRTVTIARNYVTVVETNKGRSIQQNAAAQIAHGEILFFAHAHMTLHEGTLKAIDQKINLEKYDGGGFSNVFSEHNNKIKTLGRILNLRIRNNDHANNTIFFGDNGIFVRRMVFKSLGGFKHIPIMEDYDFSKRMKVKYKVVRIQKPTLVLSPRRHTKNRFVKTRLQWIFIKRLYRFGVSPYFLSKMYQDVR